jgi:hypothetical protein
MIHRQERLPKASLTYRSQVRSSVTYTSNVFNGPTMSSNFAPTPAELALVNQIFAQADTQKIGILTGDVAVKVFQGAKLAPTVLGEIWNIADDDNNGFLTKKGVSIAVRLMGHAQKGQKVDKSLVNKREFQCSFTMTLY